MRIEISEEQQNHIYSCLLVGNSEFGKIKKSLAKLNREDQKVDDEIQTNAELRRIFNPRAEEEARERERKRSDPTQMSIGDAPSSGETGGRTRTAVEIKAIIEEEVPPTDEVIRDNLEMCDRMVLLAAIRGWPSSDRDRAAAWARAFNPYSDEAPLDPPDCIDFAAMSRERMDALNRVGPYKTRGFPEGADDTTATLIYLPGGPGEAELIEGEYSDGVEAELRCAILNRALMRDSGMAPEIVAAWSAAGPWTVVGEDVATDPAEPKPDIGATRWYVFHADEDVSERVTDQNEANGVAARYNRQEAGHEEDGSWRTPPVTEDGLQSIKAAMESGHPDDDGTPLPDESQSVDTVNDDTHAGDPNPS